MPQFYPQAGTFRSIRPGSAIRAFDSGINQSLQKFGGQSQRFDIADVGKYQGLVVKNRASKRAISRAYEQRDRKKRERLRDLAVSLGTLRYGGKGLKS